MQGMQKSTGPAPSLSRVSAAIDGLCAAVVRNSEVTLSAKGTSVCGGPGGEGTGPSCVGGPRGGARATLEYGAGRGAVQRM
ncbi:hypothetical protein GCM10009601_59790 [Streptomyces thermospinosisporus]|uniref:Uncharacterized protein n=1 Tax=Streptomyces thermospinosisporus TaxID=161482 RepID=A0ABP4JXW3_9ACTN